MPSLPDGEEKLEQEKEGEEKTEEVTAVLVKDREENEEEENEDSEKVEEVWILASYGS